MILLLLGSIILGTASSLYASSPPCTSTTNHLTVEQASDKLWLQLNGAHNRIGSLVAESGFSDEEFNRLLKFIGIWDPQRVAFYQTKEVFNAKPDDVLPCNLQVQLNTFHRDLLAAGGPFHFNISSKLAYQAISRAHLYTQMIYAVRVAYSAAGMREPRTLAEADSVLLGLNQATRAYVEAIKSTSGPPAHQVTHWVIRMMTKTKAAVISLPRVEEILVPLKEVVVQKNEDIKDVVAGDAKVPVYIPEKLMPIAEVTQNDLEGISDGGDQDDQNEEPEILSTEVEIPSTTEDDYEEIESSSIASVSVGPNEEESEIPITEPDQSFTENEQEPEVDDQNSFDPQASSSEPEILKVQKSTTDQKTSSSPRPSKGNFGPVAKYIIGGASGSLLLLAGIGYTLYKQNLLNSVFSKKTSMSLVDSESTSLQIIPTPTKLVGAADQFDIFWIIIILAVVFTVVLITAAFSWWIWQTHFKGSTSLKVAKTKTKIKTTTVRLGSLVKIKSKTKTKESRTEGTTSLTRRSSLY